MKFSSILVIIICAITSCKIEHAKNIETQIDTTKYHFAFNTFIDTTRRDSDTLQVEWYSQMLRALKEPVLLNKISNKEIYRFTWLRTFHNPISIRVEKDGKEYSLFWKLCDGKGGYDPGKLVVSKSRKISVTEWSQFLHLLEKSNFWKMELYEEILGADGSQWIIEAKNSAEYRVIDRWSPMERNPDYTACGIFLVKLTDLEIESRFIY